MMIQVPTGRSFHGTGTIHRKSGAVTRPTPNIVASSRRLGREKRTNRAACMNRRLTLPTAASPKYGANGLEVNPETRKTRLNAMTASVMKKTSFSSRITRYPPGCCSSKCCDCGQHGIALPTHGTVESCTLLALLIAESRLGARILQRRTQRRVHLDLHRVEQRLELLGVARWKESFQPIRRARPRP